MVNYKNMLLFILLSAIASVALSESFTSKDWFVGSADDGEFTFAITANANGDNIGQYCFIDSGNCLYLMTVDSSCEEDSEYPALVNSDYAAAQLKLVCQRQTDDGFVMALKDFDDIDDIALNASYMRIAFPIQDGKFSVKRFSLSGSTYAIKTMRSKAKEKMSGVTDSKKVKSDSTVL